MKKTIPVDALKVGMYLAEPAHDQNGDLLLAENITLTSINQIRRLKQANVQMVLIDSEKGLDVEPGQEITEVVDESLKETAAKVEAEIPKVKAPPTGKRPTAPAAERPSVKPAPFAEEVERADQIKQQATKIARGIYEDARAGKAIDTQEARSVVTDMIDSIFRNQFAFLSLTKLKEYDEYTFNHSVNVATLTLAIARGMGFDQKQLEEIGIGTLLHDIGKMKVPPRILNKPGKLNDEEWDEMKKHTNYGAEILRGSGFTETEVTVAEQHHERFNGSGYMNRLQNENIHLYARIASLCDVYDALTAKRVYKPPMLPHLALAMVYKEKDVNFAAEMVMNFIKIVGIYPIGSLVRLSTGEVGVVISVNQSDFVRPQVSIIFSRRGIMKRNPILTDLVQERDKSIVTTLDPRDWKIKVEDFVKNLDDGGINN
jgi:putative nucleotidyltransferase with HDIG domain